MRVITKSAYRRLEAAGRYDDETGKVMLGSAQVRNTHSATGAV